MQRQSIEGRLLLQGAHSEGDPVTTPNNPHRRANPTPAHPDEDAFSNAGKLEYLRGPAGERDRRKLWRGGQGRLPGTGEGGFVDGWMENGS